MQTDVIVLGDGIAGLSSAVLARQRGLGTVVVASSRPPRQGFYVVLHPGAEPVLDMLGIAEQVAKRSVSRPSGYWRQDPDSRELVAYGSDENGPWQGYVVQERDLADLLTIRAKQAGVTFEGSLDDTRVNVRQSVLRGVEVGGELVRSGLLIDASGGRSLVSRALGLRFLYGSPPLIARYVNHRSNVDAIPAFKAVPDGWNWSMRIRSGWASKVSMSITTNKSRAYPGRGYDVSWRYLPKCAGAGYAVVGDAALRLDPGSGSGMLRAMITGIKAVTTAYHSDGWRHYRQWISNWVRADGRKLADIYGARPFRADWPKQHSWSERRLPFYCS